MEPSIQKQETMFICKGSVPGLCPLQQNEFVGDKGRMRKGLYKVGGLLKNTAWKSTKGKFVMYSENCEKLHEIW